MAVSSFSVSIVPHAECVLAGLRVATNLQSAAVDCPEVWEKFMPRAVEITGLQPKDAFMGVSYGVSYMTSSDSASEAFDYVAAMPLAADKSVPAGMERFVLPKGLYARVLVEKLENLGAAYMYLYSAWPAEQAEYAVNMAASCFERYDERYPQSGVFEVYVPVLKK